MVANPLRPCRRAGCRRLHHNRSGFCDRHEKEYNEQARLAARRTDDRRGSAQERGYDVTWRRLRLMQLRKEPLCRMCKADGRITPAVMVDHIIPIEGRDDPRRLDEDNLQSLCRTCHDVKHKGISTLRQKNDEGGSSGPKGIPHETGQKRS
jgi:5-methylcytosine-specific restriction protein A